MTENFDRSLKIEKKSIKTKSDDAAFTNNNPYHSNLHYDSSLIPNEAAHNLRESFRAINTPKCTNLDAMLTVLSQTKNFFNNVQNCDHCSCMENYLRDVVAKMEVGKIQKEILNALETLQSNDEKTQEAIVKLNIDVYDLTTLYENFCEPFGLWRCKLLIAGNASLVDNDLILNLWMKRIEDFVTKENSFELVAKRVFLDLQTFDHPCVCCPLGQVVRCLETAGMHMGVFNTYIPTLLLSLNIPIATLLDCYVNMIFAGCGPVGTTPHFYRMHIYDCLFPLLHRAIENLSSFFYFERRKLCQYGLELASCILTDLAQSGGEAKLYEAFRNLQITFADALRDISL